MESFTWDVNLLLVISRFLFFFFYKIKAELRYFIIFKMKNPTYNINCWRLYLFLLYFFQSNIAQT